jgi:hypothetical protein
MADNNGSERKSVGRPFPKGVSGNPGGVPKTLFPIRAAARKHAESALQTLVDGLKANKLFGPGAVVTPDWAARLAAATALLDRCFGKPKQAVELTGEDGGPIQVEAVKRELAERIAARLLEEKKP